MRIRVAFVSVLPSPYQRDLFGALANRDEIALQVYYLERTTPDSPWPATRLRPFESVLTGFCLQTGGVRTHFNAPPKLSDVDLVVLNSLMAATAQWLMRVQLRNRKWVFWGEKLRGNSGGIRRRLHSALCSALNGATAIAAVGARAKADYERRFPGTRIYNIPYHCDLERFRAAAAAMRESSPAPTFLFCGQMIARKGIDRLLNAFNVLASEHPSVRLLLVGREAELPSLLEKLPLTVRDRVEYAGFQNPENLPGYFARTDVFVLPSRYDGWGVVVNQAIGAGLPILCSDEVGAGYDLVVHGVNGERFTDEHSLLDAMRIMTTDEKYRRKCAAASAALAPDWTPGRGADKWITAIREICEAP